MMRKASLAKSIRELADEATGRCRSWWLVSLAEPPCAVFATTRDHAHTTLLCVLMQNRVGASIHETDARDVVCVRTGVPLCALGVSEEFMAGLMQTLRANGFHGTYKNARTGQAYPF